MCYTDDECTRRWTNGLGRPSKAGGLLYWLAGLYWQKTRQTWDTCYLLPGMQPNGEEYQGARSYYGLYAVETKPMITGEYLTDAKALDAALTEAVKRFGGIDMLVLNAGIFPSSQPIQDIGQETWRNTMAVNVEAGLLVMQACHGLMKVSPRGGRIAVVGSKNVPAPGPGAAAYSASKAALNQLARVAALEWGKYGIRVNSLHPNAVYDTALWTDEVLAARAKAYNLSVEQYKRNNLLRTEVGSKDVAELAAELCGPLFAKTTGAQVPVDGGNERVV